MCHILLVVELIQSLVFLGNCMNLVNYFLKYMHYPVAQSSNMLTNFVGISYFLTIVAGFINDSYLTKLTAFVLYATIELLGVVLLTYQAKNSNLLPPENETPSTFQASILYIGLGAMAIGIGGSKATLPTHGADQLDHTKQSLISSFFNWYYISILAASILAATLMVWIEESYGWGWSFMISAILICCSISIFLAGFPLYRCKKPSGSPIKRMVKVFVASVRNTNDTTTVEVHPSAKKQSYAKEKSYNKFKFLNKALNDDTIEITQVEETKSFLGLLPIFATTIMLNCCVAQFMTFPVQQGNFMNRKIYNFTITTQSISLIPLVVVLVLLYLVEQSKRFYGNNEVINIIYQPHVRMGVGLALSSVSMAVAAMVEYKRLSYANCYEKLLIKINNMCFLIVVVELIQTLVFLGNSMNLVRYFLKYMHYSVAQSSNMLTNFVGISYFLTIVAGYINDSYLTKLTAFVLYATIELLGVILLTYQAKNSNLLPPENETPSTFQAAILYIGLGAMAIGIGGSKATLPTHGADQLDHTKQSLISSFFNWYYISITIGGILASTLMVIVASKQNTNDTTTIEVYQSAKEQSYAKEKSYDKFKFLNKALNDDTIEVAQVEETKAFLSLLPIFATTFLLNCVVAQLMTFSVQQGNFMNRKIYNFTLTTQSISMIPLVAVLVLLYLLEQSKRFYGNNEAINKIYQPLVRIGVGLAGSTVSMAVGAIVEYKRLKEFNKGNLMSAFWLIAQTLLSSLSEVITVGGTLELFYSKAPNGMRSICTSLSWCSTSMGYFLSTVLVTVCNSVSGRFGQAWIGGQDLNHDRLDLFYALLSFLSLINFVVFVILARGF
ncbi:hypothetical protein TanjilG_28398 [Lupinus angustifolius]|uniref:Uncharacterized protein n=1 Tax=Lupinus angustifolius TaxID=3871 RepID=A0A394DDK8_LUPAN|nr:hypothetical protein TanjilG_28398 [Lupinus angustifolius]